MEYSANITAPSSNQPAITGHAFFTSRQSHAGVSQNTSQDKTPFTDTISLSDQGRQRYDASLVYGQEELGENTNEQPGSEDKENESAELTAEEQRELQKLSRRDAEVRAHEQAHLSTAGSYAAGGASFSYEVGPNGKRYATGGEVPIDLSKASTPQETIMKMQVVRRAALAPANPSSADRRIAARASQIANQARSEMMNTLSSQQAKPDTADAEDGRFSSAGIQSRNSAGDQPQPSTVSPNTRQMVLKAYLANIE